MQEQFWITLNKLNNKMLTNNYYLFKWTPRNHSKLHLQRTPQCNSPLFPSLTYYLLYRKQLQSILLILVLITLSSNSNQSFSKYLVYRYYEVEFILCVCQPYTMIDRFIPFKLRCYFLLHVVPWWFYATYNILIPFRSLPQQKLPSLIWFS
jgi:hypothetical protein